MITIANVLQDWYHVKNCFNANSDTAFDEIKHIKDNSNVTLNL